MNLNVVALHKNYLLNYAKYIIYMKNHRVSRPFLTPLTG